VDVLSTKLSALLGLKGWIGAEDCLPWQRDFSGLGDEFSIKLGRLATDMGGSFAAEHGLGRSKTALAVCLRDPVERNLMERVKKALDVEMQLNPGVLVSSKNAGE
jgi:hypothetical protein